jgi:hypothetical protein
MNKSTLAVAATFAMALGAQALSFAGSSPTIPDPASLSQIDGTGAPLAAGATAPSHQVTLRGTVTTSGLSTAVRLEVEIQPVGAAFTGAATHNSVFVVPGSDAEVVVSPLDGSYHWQARAIDSLGGLSSWVSFGGNLESDTDFTIQSATGGGDGHGCGFLGIEALALLGFGSAIRAIRRIRKPCERL